jgi:hypothetical protein
MSRARQGTSRSGSSRFRSDIASAKGHGDGRAVRSSAFIIRHRRDRGWADQVRAHGDQGTAPAFASRCASREAAVSAPRPWCERAVQLRRDPRALRQSVTTVRAAPCLHWLRRDMDERRPQDRAAPTDSRPLPSSTVAQRYRGGWLYALLRGGLLARASAQSTTDVSGVVEGIRQVLRMPVGARFSPERRRPAASNPGPPAKYGLMWPTRSCRQTGSAGGRTDTRAGRALAAVAAAAGTTMKLRPSPRHFERTASGIAGFLPGRARRSDLGTKRRRGRRAATYSCYQCSARRTRRARGYGRRGRWVSRDGRWRVDRIQLTLTGSGPRPRMAAGHRVLLLKARGGRTGPKERHKPDV